MNKLPSKSSCSILEFNAWIEERDSSFCKKKVLVMEENEVGDVGEYLFFFLLTWWVSRGESESESESESKG